MEQHHESEENMSTNDKERAPMMPGDVEGVAEASPGPEGYVL